MRAPQPGSWLLLGLAACEITTTGNPTASPPQVVNPESGCEEERRAIGFDETTSLGFAVADVLPLLSTGKLGAPLHWSAGGDTTLTLELTPLQASFVTSVGPSGPQVLLPHDCADYLEITSRARLLTQDGKLDEDLPSLLLRARTSDTVSGRVNIEAAYLRGSYELAAGSSECLTLVDVSFSILRSRAEPRASTASTGFGGNLLGTVANSPCSDVSGNSAAFPREIASWNTHTDTAPARR